MSETTAERDTLMVGDFITDSECPVKGFERFASPAYGYLAQTSSGLEKVLLRIAFWRRKRRTIKYMKKTIKGWERKLESEQPEAEGEII